MSTFILSHHVIDQLTGDRPLMSIEMLQEVVQVAARKVSRYSPANVHQVAVRVCTLPRTIKMGYSAGNTLIIMFDIRSGKIPTAFLRNEWQGMPKMASVYIDLDGTVLQTR